MNLAGLDRRVTSLEVLQPTERDTRQDLGWPAYKDTLLKYLADYPQKGLLEDVQRAFEDLEGRPAPVTNADVFYAIDPILRKHYEEFAPNPQTADHLALIARFKALGASDEDLVDFYKYVRKYQEEDKYRITGKCALYEMLEAKLLKAIEKRLDALEKNAKPRIISTLLDLVMFVDSGNDEEVELSPELQELVGHVQNR